MNPDSLGSRLLASLGRGGEVAPRNHTPADHPGEPVKPGGLGRRMAALLMERPSRATPRNGTSGGFQKPIQAKPPFVSSHPDPGIQVPDLRSPVESQTKETHSREAVMLLEHLRRVGSAGLSRKELHATRPAGLGRRAARAAIQQLVAAGLVTSAEEVRPSGQKATVYRVKGADRVPEGATPAANPAEKR